MGKAKRFIVLVASSLLLLHPPPGPRAEGLTDADSAVIRNFARRSAAIKQRQELANQAATPADPLPTSFVPPTSLEPRPDAFWSGIPLPQPEPWLYLAEIEQTVRELAHRAELAETRLAAANRQANAAAALSLLGLVLGALALVFAWQSTRLDRIARKGRTARTSAGKMPEERMTASGHRPQD